LQRRIAGAYTSYRQCHLADAACRTFNSFKTRFQNEKRIEELTQRRRPIPELGNAHASITLIEVERALRYGSNAAAIRRVGHWIAAFQR
jgi:hypothetical protein